MRISILTVLILASLASLPAYAQENAEYCYDFDQSIPANGEAGCFDANNFWDCQTCYCGFNQEFDYYINLTLSAMGILSTLLVIIGFIGSKSLRKAPGDIILALSLGDFVWSIIWFKISLDNITDFTICQNMCLTYSYIYNSSRYIKTAYYLFFCLYYYNTLNYSLKGSRIPDWFYHVGALSLATIVFCYKLFDQNSFGMAVNGACGTKTSGSYNSVSEQFLVFTILPIFLLIKTSRSLKTGDMYQKKLQQFLSYYKFYVIGTAVLYFFIFLADITEIYLLPEYFQETMLHDDTDTGQKIAIISIQMATFLRSGHPIILTQLRMRDPLMREYWGKIFCCYDTKNGDEEFKTQDISDKSVEMMQQKLMDASYIKQFQHSLKVQTVYSILSSLQYYWAKFKQGKNINTSDLNYETEVREKISMRITEDFLNKEMPELLSEVRKNKYTVCDGTFTVYAPKIFDLTIKLDDLWDVMTNSLDLKKNFARILKAGINGGGKSGEFFFFSSDNKLIIKTITEKEVKIFLRVLPQITRYYELNKNSLIAKTYGLFSFERDGAQEKYNFILMKNINGYPSTCVERKYDLKGSTYTRNTIRNDLDVELGRLKYYDTLKDLDFLKYEQKFWIDDEMKIKFIEVLRRDSMFLRELGLIDYSLALYIINKEIPKGEEDLNRSTEASRGSEMNLAYNAPEINQGYQNPFASMKSVKEPYYYNVGVIDFLTIYTCKKRWEKYAKRIQNRDWKLDTSVQNPTKYSERFIRFFEQVTL